MDENDENRFYGVSPKDILNAMKINICDNYINNSYQFISTDYLLSRSFLLSLIRKIYNKMNFKSQTYYLSIYYLDILFSKNKRIEFNYNILGLACLLLSAKFVEDYVPSLEIFVKKYNDIVNNKNFISVTDLLYGEVLTCKMLEYKLNYYSIYDFSVFFFGHGFIKYEQLEEIDNISNSNYSNNETLESNDLYSFIRRILQEIYSKLRQFLDLIVENNYICLKYNSLILSIFIIKKSIEEILLEEKGINNDDLIRKEQLLNKTSKYFKELMIELYQIDYESMEEYIELNSDKELIKILSEEKINEIPLIDLVNNKRFVNKNSDKQIKNIKLEEYKFRDNNKKILSYIHNNRFHPNNNISFTDLNKKENQIQKLNLNDKIINNNYQRAMSQRSFRISSNNKNKKNKLNINCLEFSNLSNAKELIKINKELINKNRALSRQTEMKYIKYSQRLSTYKNLSVKNRNVSNTKIKGYRCISLENNDINNSIDNDNNINKNKTLRMESPIILEKHNEYYLNNRKNMNQLNGKVLNVNNSLDENEEYSLIDNLNIQNTNNTERLIDINNIINLKKSQTRPYFRKIIKNTINYDSINNSKIKKIKQGLSGKKRTSYFCINRDNIGKRYIFNSNVKQVPINKSEDKIIDDNLYSNQKENHTLENRTIVYDNYFKRNRIINVLNNNNNDGKNTINKIKQKLITNNMSQKNDLFNNFDNKINEQIEEKEMKEIIVKNEKSKYSSTSNFYLKKRREREKLLLNRMNNINNKNEYKNEIINKTNIIKKNEEEIIKGSNNNNKNNTEIEENKKDKKEFKKGNDSNERQYFLTNKKSKRFNNKIRPRNNNSEEEMNLNDKKCKFKKLGNDNSELKENEYKSIRKKYLFKKIKNNDVNQNKDNKEKNNNENKEEKKIVKDTKENKIIDIKVNRINVNKHSNKNNDIDADDKKIKEKEKNKLNKKGDIKEKEKENKKELKNNMTKSQSSTSSIFKLLNQTKNLTKNIKLSEDPLKIDLKNNYIMNYNKNKRLLRTRTRENIKNNDKKMEANNITKKNIIQREISSQSLNYSNERIINANYKRNLMRNKINKNFFFSNKNSNNNSNNDIIIEDNLTNTIVINNNININFNNKFLPIQASHMYNGNLKGNLTEINNEKNNNNNYLNKIIINKTNKNNYIQNTIIEKNNDNSNRNRGNSNNRGGTIDYINYNKNNNIQTNSISSLLRRMPNIKHNLDNNRKRLSRQLSVEYSNH